MNLAGLSEKAVLLFLKGTHMALLKYILKKMLMLLPVLVGISIIAFALGIMSPGIRWTSAESKWK